MSDKSSIQWTDATWNPVSGCTKVSPGCDHCYAETFAERFRGVKGHHFENGFDLTLRPSALLKPFHWRNKRVFVNSMSDLFHRDVPDEFIEKVFAVMAATIFCPYRNTFQVLTKRPERMRRMMERVWEMAEPRKHARGTVMESVWLGVSVESEDYAWRSNMLHETPAAVRFLSCEPLLAPLPSAMFAGMDWVIVGGESGAGHRPMDLDWARSIRDCCKVNDIPFFFKQVGAFRPTDEMIPADLRIREYPSNAAAKAVIA